jgi:hypothetical protein
VSQLSSDCSALKRSQARLRGELTLEAAKVAALKQKLAGARSDLEAAHLELQQHHIYSSSEAGGGAAELQPEGWLAQRLQELQAARARQQQLIAKLAGRAEAAEVEAAALRAELEQRAPAAGTSALALAGAVGAGGQPDYYREMLVREAELRTTRWAGRRWRWCWCCRPGLAAAAAPPLLRPPCTPPPPSPAIAPAPQRCARALHRALPPQCPACSAQPSRSAAAPTLAAGSRRS